MTADEDPEPFDPNMDYKKYESFVTETLEPKLKALLGQREVLVAEIEGYASVPELVASFQEQASHASPIRKLVEVGCGVACQAEAIPKGTLCLSLGLDSVVELSYAEAIAAAKDRQDLLEKKCEALDGEIVDCVNDIEQVLGSLAQLKQLRTDSV